MEHNETNLIDLPFAISTPGSDPSNMMLIKNHYERKMAHLQKTTNRQSRKTGYVTGSTDTGNIGVVADRRRIILVFLSTTRSYHLAGDVTHNRDHLKSEI